MKKLQLLLMMMFVFVALGVQAQDGTKPYKGSTHTYKIDKGMTKSTLAWSVSSGAADGYTIYDADKATASVKWLSTGTYILQVTETRNAASGYVGCPVTRQIEVVVGENNFDVYADLVTDEEACATVNPSIVVDVDGDGSNSNDVFGTTTREFLITAENATGDWDFTYTLTSTGVSTDDLTVKNGTTDISATGGTISVAAGTTTQTITVSYTTNNNQQDIDFDLALTITGATDSLGTSDGDATAGKTDDATYTVYAMPATTGIIAD